MIGKLSDLEQKLEPFATDKSIVSSIRQQIETMNTLIYSLKTYINLRGNSLTSLKTDGFADTMQVLMAEMKPDMTVDALKATQLYQFVKEMALCTTGVMPSLSSIPKARAYQKHFLPRFDCTLSSILHCISDLDAEYIIDVIKALHTISTRVMKIAATCPYNFDEFIKLILPTILEKYGKSEKLQLLIKGIFDTIKENQSEFSCVIRDKTALSIIDMVSAINASAKTVLARYGLTVQNALEIMTQLLSNEGVDIESIPASLGLAVPNGDINNPEEKKDDATKPVDKAHEGDDKGSDGDGAKGQ